MEFEQKAEEKKMSMSKNIARLAVTAGLTAALSFGGVMAPVSMAFADDPVTAPANGIIIEQSENNKGTAKTRFVPYQIFKAKVHDGENGKVTSDVDWADTITQTTKDQIITDIRSDASNGKKLSGTPSAQDVADWLGTYVSESGRELVVKNGDLLNKIAAIVKKNEQPSGTAFNAGDSFTPESAGYYLFLTDDNSIGTNKDYSNKKQTGTSPIFAVVGGTGVTVTEKTGIPTVTKKVKDDKGSTILSMQELKDAEEAHGKAASEVHKEVKLTGRQKGVLIAFAFTFVVMIVGFIPLADLNEGVANFFDAGAVYDADGNTVVQGWSALITGLPIGQWYFDEASTWFFLMAVLIGIIGGLSEKQIVNTFITGAADMMSVVLVIALARGISVLMANTGLDVYVLDAAANALAGLSGVIFAPMSFLVYFGLSFLIPSTSGMATVSMPIMGPLAVKLGFSPEVMVMIFSAAIGVVNLFTPTSGAIMGGLALAKIEWTTWLKFALKLIVALSVVCAVILTVACVLI